MHRSLPGSSIHDTATTKPHLVDQFVSPSIQPSTHPPASQLTAVQCTLCYCPRHPPPPPAIHPIYRQLLLLRCTIHSLSQSVQNIPAFNESPKLVQQHSTEKRKFHWFAYIIIWMHFLQPNFCDWTMNKFKFIIAVQSTPETTLDHFNSFSLS